MRWKVRTGRGEDKFILNGKRKIIEVNTSLFSRYNDWSGCSLTIGRQWEVYK
jgi:hypothetical protein